MVTIILLIFQFLNNNYPNSDISIKLKLYGEISILSINFINLIIYAFNFSNRFKNI